MDPDDPRVAAVRENVRHFNEDRDAWVAALPGDVVIATDPSWPDGGVFSGREAALEFVGKFEEAWSSVTFQLDAFEEAHGRIAARARWIVRGTTSGVETELAFWVVWLLRGPDHEVAGAYFFLDHDAAVAFACAQPADRVEDEPPA